MWGLVLAALLVGAATGGWWSRRRAVAQAFVSGHASGEASALALAQGGSVVFNGLYSDEYDSTDRSDDYDYDDGTCRVGSDLQRRAEHLGRLAAARQYLDDGSDLGIARSGVGVGSNRRLNRGR
jgi:hypothetical protein